MIRKRVRIHGKVQGVWFRDSTVRTAQALGLQGWVRNRRDGTVEAVFEGPTDVVDEAVDWCRLGPPQARVSEIEIEDEPLVGERGFARRPTE
ncbi:MAG: acylphosphatase [Deltaproteobacteria bacterium]|nr:MAG: acylphosphatase [Deltaproteobacteria bacterium]